MMEARKKMQKKRQCTQFYVFLTTIMTTSTITTWRSVNSKWFYICVYRVHLHFRFFSFSRKGETISIAWCVYSVSARNNILVSPWLRFCCVLDRTGQSWCKFQMDEVIHVVVILMFILRKTRHFAHSLRRPVCRLLTDLALFIITAPDRASGGIWIYVSYIRINDNDNYNRYVIN